MTFLIFSRPGDETNKCLYDFCYFEVGYLYLYAHNSLKYWIDQVLDAVLHFYINFISSSSESSCNLFDKL